jgi:diadenosine tetraphosphate (Ap4A) HIT family hydrolase
LTDLTQSERITLMEEIAAVSEALSARAGADKLNIGALGNIVRQLHVHIVARKFSDAAWPGPVWGFGARHSYEQTAAKVFAGQLVEALVGILTD